MICLDEAQCATGREETEAEKSYIKPREVNWLEEGQKGKTSGVRNYDRVKEGDE